MQHFFCVGVLQLYGILLDNTAHRRACNPVVSARTAGRPIRPSTVAAQSHLPEPAGCPGCPSRNNVETKRQDARGRRHLSRGRADQVLAFSNPSPKGGLTYRFQTIPNSDLCCTRAARSARAVPIRLACAIHPAPRCGPSK